MASKYVKATKDTLQNIAALTMTHARDLNPDDALEDDLGYGDKEFGNLAIRQRRVGDRLREDGGNTRILASDLKKSETVRGVLGLTIKRAVGEQLDGDELDALIAQAKEEL